MDTGLGKDQGRKGRYPSQKVDKNSPELFERPFDKKEPAIYDHFQRSALKEQEEESSMED